MVLDYRAIVLSVQDSGDADKTARLLTEEGIKFVSFRGVKKPQAKFKMAAACFAYGEYGIPSNSNIIASFVPIDEFTSLILDYDRYILASIACECASIAAAYDKNTKGLLDALIGFLCILKNTVIDFDSDSINDTSDTTIGDIYELATCRFIQFLLAVSGYNKTSYSNTVIGMISEFESIFEQGVKSKKLLTDG